MLIFSNPFAIKQRSFPHGLLNLTLVRLDLLNEFLDCVIKSVDIFLVLFRLESEFLHVAILLVDVLIRLCVLALF